MEDGQHICPHRFFLTKGEIFCSLQIFYQNPNQTLFMTYTAYIYYL